MKHIVVEVMGPDPPCMRCLAVKKNAQGAAAKLRGDGIDVEITNVNIMSRDTIKRYGLLFSPAMTVNGIVKFMGRIPSQEEIEQVARESYHSGGT
jgi:hypothetical protein